MDYFVKDVPTIFSAEMGSVTSLLHKLQLNSSSSIKPPLRVKASPMKTQDDVTAALDAIIPL